MVKKTELETHTYILELTTPSDNNRCVAKLESLIEQLKDIFIQHFPSSLVNLTVSKIDLDQKKEKNNEKI